MVTLTESQVDSAAPNADACKNGRGLVLKKKFLKLHVSSDGNLLFGECQGSGKDPYHCSVDYARADQPTYRCSCPSRQFPCKHCLGLMYAFALKQPFSEAEVPADLQAKREKLQDRETKKKEEPAKPKKVNLGALAKKVKAQLEGIDTLEKLTHDLVRIGIGNMNAKLASQMEAQAKRLGDVYLPGARAALLRYTQLFADDSGKFATDKNATRTEQMYTEALDQLGRLHAIIKQGRAYLQKQLEDPNLAVPTDSAIAAWLGHAWQLADLKAAGLVETDAELVQLAFNSHYDAARQEYIDTGIWMTLSNGRIRVTQTLRPIKAVKYIKSEDSVFDVLQVPELCIYPGSINPRIRWDGMRPRPMAPGDYETIHKHAAKEFAPVVKEVKSVLKAPLADRTPIYALRFKRLGMIGADYVLEDARGDRLVLTDQGMTEEPASCAMLPLLPAEIFQNHTLIARFRHDLDTRQLRIKPLSIVTDSAIIRMTL